MENFTNQNYHGNYKNKRIIETNIRLQNMSFREVGRLSHLYTQKVYRKTLRLFMKHETTDQLSQAPIDELPKRSDCRLDPSSPGRRTDWDEVMVSPGPGRTPVSSNGLSRHTKVPDEHQTNLSRSSGYNVSPDEPLTPPTRSTSLQNSTTSVDSTSVDSTTSIVHSTSTSTSVDSGLYDETVKRSLISSNLR